MKALGFAHAASNGTGGSPVDLRTVNAGNFPLSYPRLVPSSES
jgi:hypothetical protein